MISLSKFVSNEKPHLAKKEEDMPLSTSATHYLEKLIDNYRQQVLPLFPENISEKNQETNVLKDFMDLISSKKNFCFDRHCLPGHITGSCILVDKKFSKVVLTHHKKLNKWLQLGGHSDGDNIISRVAYREAVEESGISDIDFCSPLSLDISSQTETLPLDFDIHLIPARESEAEHYHFDVRFILIANDSHLTISEESNDLRWFDFYEVKEITSERSTLRQIEKIRWLKESIKKNKVNIG